MHKHLRNLRQSFRAKALGLSGRLLLGKESDTVVTAGHAINIGGGRFSRPGWINLDYEFDGYHQGKTGFQPFDIMRREELPFPTKSIYLAYTSHVIEHLDNESVGCLFSEVYRVLATGSVFRVTCPNVDAFYFATLLNKRSFFEGRFHWFKNKGAKSVNEVLPLDYLISEICTARSRFLTGTSAEDILLLDINTVEKQLRTLDKEAFLNWLVAPCEFDYSAPGNHINFWHHAKLANYLYAAGFSEVVFSSFGASVEPALRDISAFDNTIPRYSLYIDAIK